MKTQKKRPGCDAHPARCRNQNGSGQHDHRPHDIQRTIPDGLPDGLAETVADRLKRSLRYAGMSQKEMAAHFGMHRNAVTGYVTGRHRIKPALLRVWAAEVGVPVEWITSGNWPKADA